MEQITSSYNLFVDTSRSHTTGSKGDDFLINLQDAGVHASDGEHIRLNLENFSMAKTFTDVNATNNKIRVRGTSNGTVGSPTLYTTTGGDTFVDVPGLRLSIQPRLGRRAQDVIRDECQGRHPWGWGQSSTKEGVLLHPHAPRAPRTRLLQRSHGLGATRGLVQVRQVASCGVP